MIVQKWVELGVFYIKNLHLLMTISLCTESALIKQIYDKLLLIIKFYLIILIDINNLNGNF